MDMPEGHTAHESSSGRKRFTYQGRKVLLNDPGGDATPMMTIDGTDVMIRREEGGGYSAPMLNMHGPAE